MFAVNIPHFDGLKNLFESDKIYSNHNEIIASLTEMLKDYTDSEDFSNFCSNLYHHFVKFSSGDETEEKTKFFCVLEQITTMKPTEINVGHLILVESLIPFIKLLCPVYGISLSKTSYAFQYKDTSYVLYKDSLRFDTGGKIFDELEKTPVSDGSHDTSHSLLEGIKKLVETPPFTSEELPENELISLLSGKQKVFKSLEGGVAKAPESPSPTVLSYASMTVKNTPVSTPSKECSPMSPIPEDTDVPEDTSIKGVLYIPEGKNMCFINRLKQNGAELTDEVNGKKVVKDSIFCSRFYGYEFLRGHKVKIPKEFLSHNRNEGQENQFYPLKGFMQNLQVEYNNKWKFILDVKV